MTRVAQASKTDADKEFMSTHMHTLNKHLMAMAPAPAGKVVLFPFHLLPEHILPMTDAAALNCDIEAAADTDYIVITIGAERWIRKPERRNLQRRQETARQLRDAAKLYSVPSFVQYISDCGFKVS